MMMKKKDRKGNITTPQGLHLAHHRPQIEATEMFLLNPSPLASAFNKLKILIPAYNAEITVTGTVSTAAADHFRMVYRHDKIRSTNVIFPKISNLKLRIRQKNDPFRFIMQISCQY